MKIKPELLASLIADIKSHDYPVQWPLSVSYHGDSTILVGANGRWATGSVPRDDAEAIARQLNFMVARCVFAPDSICEVQS